MEIDQVELKEKCPAQKNDEKHRGRCMKDKDWVGGEDEVKRVSGRFLCWSNQYSYNQSCNSKRSMQPHKKHNAIYNSQLFLTDFHQLLCLEV